LRVHTNARRDCAWPYEPSFPADKRGARVVRLHHAALESVTPMQRVLNLLFRLLSLVVVPAVFGFLQLAVAQNSRPSQDLGHQEDPANQQDTSKEPQAPPVQPLASAEKASRIETNSSGFVLGPGDEVEITVYGAPDLSGHTRVSAAGNISMPLIGYVRVAGLSSSAAEAAIEAQLRQNNIVNDPQVSVYAKEYSNSGISVAGEITRPGVYSALGPHRLFDILQAAGGLSERASGLVTISHKGNENNPVTVEVTKDPAEMVRNNVELYPGDTVFVAKAAMVYVLGEVNKPGAYILNSTGAVTVLQVVAAAGGPTHAAGVGGTRMLRKTPTGLQELPVPLKALLRGKTADIPVEAGDILFVPSSHMKAFVTASSIVASTTATAAIYRVF
jgi:polysaccharide export outer membrane protein